MSDTLSLSIKLSPGLLPSKISLPDLQANLKFLEDNATTLKNLFEIARRMLDLTGSVLTTIGGLTEGRTSWPMVLHMFSKPNKGGNARRKASRAKTSGPIVAVADARSVTLVDFVTSLAPMQEAELFGGHRAGN